MGTVTTDITDGIQGLTLDNFIFLNLSDHFTAYLSELCQRNCSK